MPTVWTPANELKLAIAIIGLRQVKVSNEDQARLAAIVGDGCTAKAISHRLGKFKTYAADLGLGDGAAVPATAIVPAVRATPKKRACKTDTDEDGDGGGGKPTPAKKQRTTKAKKNAVKAEEDLVEEESIKKEIPDHEETEDTAC